MVMPVPDPTKLVVAVLYLVCITERILYLIDDIAIILHVTDARFIWVL
jgi:hypothetical protein